MHRILLIIGLLLFFCNCTKRPIVKPPIRPVDEQFELAMANLKKKLYDKAITGFSDIIFNYPGSRYAADAQYYLAVAYFEKRDYVQAITEFDFFIKNFPASQFIESAMVKLALAYLRSNSNIERDQIQLIKASELLMEVQEKFPNSEYRSEIEKVQTELEERLANKEFKAASLYFRAGEFEAARIYYEHILEHYPKTTWAHKAKFPLAIAYFNNGAFEQARQLFEELASDSTQPVIQRKAIIQLKKLEDEVLKNRNKENLNELVPETQDSKVGEN
ncbi:MAG: outer membrane protein assembly factor BamD [candidate division WOR-3 bacterium]